MFKIIQTQHEHGRVEAYVDCFVLGAYGSLKYLSFFGGTASVKAIAAQIIGGYGKVRLLEDGNYVVNTDDQPLEIKRERDSLRMLTQNIKPGVTHKTLFSVDAFQPWKREGVQEFLTFGADHDQAKKRAFQIIDKMSKAPLSAGWTDWLWGLLTEGSDHSLPIVGGDVQEFNSSLLLTVPSDETLEQRIKDDLPILKSL